jgi:hypothetical protein
MSRNFASSADHLDSNTPLFPGLVGGFFAWAYQSDQAANKFYMANTVAGSTAEALALSSDFNGATGLIAAQSRHANASVQVLTKVPLGTNVWQLITAAFNGSSYRQSTVGSVAASKNTPGTSGNSPSGLNSTIIGARQGPTNSAHAQLAHCGGFSRVPTDLEIEFLRLGGNPRALGVVIAYYKLDPTQSPAGIETDLIGTNNFTVTGAAAGSLNPNLATWMTNGPMPNLVLGIGSNPSKNLGALFDNVSSAFTCSIRQLGLAVQVGATVAAQGTASQTVVATAIGALARGDWVQIGNGGQPTPVLNVDASTGSILVQTAQTWALNAPVFRIPANAFTATGFPISGNVLSPAPVSVATYAQCAILATCNADSTIFSYSNLFSITVGGSSIPTTIRRRRKRRVFVRSFIRR